MDGDQLSFGITRMASLVRYTFTLAVMYSFDLSLSSMCAVEVSALASCLRIPMVINVMLMLRLVESWAYTNKTWMPRVCTIINHLKY